MTAALEKLVLQKIGKGGLQYLGENGVSIANLNMADERGKKTRLCAVKKSEGFIYKNDIDEQFYFVENLVVGIPIDLREKGVIFGKPGYVNNLDLFNKALSDIFSNSYYNSYHNSFDKIMHQRFACYKDRDASRSSFIGHIIVGGLGEALHVFFSYGCLSYFMQHGLKTRKLNDKELADFLKRDYRVVNVTGEEYVELERRLGII